VLPSTRHETESKRTRNGIKRIDLSLSSASLLGLFYIQRYRFLTIGQYARIASLNHDTATKQLRRLEEHGLLGYFGNTGIRGYGKTPKAYFLTRKGFELLRRESEIPPELIGTHKEVKVESRWSPQMYHRLRTVDLMISAEVAVRKRPHLSMVQTFLEYRRIRRGNHIARETTDFVAKEEIAENRIIPDAAFILENIETKRRGLFFVEMDMATERIVSHITRDSRITLHYKIEQYDRYLQSLQYRQTYAAYGDFRSFTLLFVTLGSERVENVRREMHDLPAELAHYFRFSTFELAMGDFFGPIWKSRSLADTNVYSLVRE
jgi:DNA-binding PadR family transcriptional regulator